VANVPKRGGALVLSNHQSFLDPMLVGCPGPRFFHFMARHTLFRNGLIGWILRWVNAFPVERGRADRAAIRTAIERLKAGHGVVMFPEGTRSPDGELQAMKGGFRLLVRKAHVPVLPVVVDGAFKAWPRSQKLPRPSPVSVIYGQCIPPEEFDNLSDDEAAERIQREMAALLAELRRKRAVTCQV
jgi:1-acyl-sn-glycerol-3-phosphate acyltransferase